MPVFGVDFRCIQDMIRVKSQQQGRYFSGVFIKKVCSEAVHQPQMQDIPGQLRQKWQETVHTAQRIHRRRLPGRRGWPAGVHEVLTIQHFQRNPFIIAPVGIVYQVVRNNHCDTNRRPCQDHGCRTDTIRQTLYPGISGMPEIKKNGQHQQGANRSEIARRAELHRVNAANYPNDG